MGGWGVSYPNFFGFLYIFDIYKAPYPVFILSLQLCKNIVHGDLIFEKNLQISV